MKLTLTEANKQLKDLNNDYTTLSNIESQSKEFLCAMGEDVESVRPQYDFKRTQKELNLLRDKIRKLKHKINVANVTTIVSGYEMTIDEVLVYIPQLSAQFNKLYGMRGKLKKTREQGYNKNTSYIDYRYINYDVEEVEKESKKVQDELSKVQIALDYTNSITEIEI